MNSASLVWPSQLRGRRGGLPRSRGKGVGLLGSASRLGTGDSMRGSVRRSRVWVKDMRLVLALSPKDRVWRAVGIEPYVSTLRKIEN